MRLIVALTIAFLAVLLGFAGFLLTEHLAFSKAIEFLRLVASRAPGAFTAGLLFGAVVIYFVLKSDTQTAVKIIIILVVAFAIGASTFLSAKEVKRSHPFSDRVKLGDFIDDLKDLNHRDSSVPFVELQGTQAEREIIRNLKKETVDCDKWMDCLVQVCNVNRQCLDCKLDKDQNLLQITLRSTARANLILAGSLYVCQ